MITELWRKEFSYRCLMVNHNKPSDFYKTQWQTNNTVNIYYLVYRWVLALTFLVTLALSIVDVNHPEQSAVNRLKWMIYLTHWGYAGCTIQAFLAVFIITSVYMKQRTKSIEYIPESHINPKLYSVYWVLFTIATDSAFGITCIYWTLIYDVKIHTLDALNIFVHGINSVLMMTDLFIVAHPVRLLHCYWPFLFAVVYVIFNVIYYMAGGTDKLGNNYIYSILDWQYPSRSVLITFLALMFLVFLHMLTYCMFLVRRSIYNKYFPNNVVRDKSALTMEEAKGSELVDARNYNHRHDGSIEEYL